MLALLLPMVAFAAPPRAVDDRLTIALFAEHPQIVTPVGLDVDRRGRVFVVESHTHFRPDGYTGPPADRIRVFEDTNGDGAADKITTFFEGEHQTMSVAFAPDGSLYVATRREVFRLYDADGDGVADAKRDTIAKLETKGDYPHNGLCGFAFDFAGNVYFGFGENLGEDYKLIGADGTTLTGGGEGGNIYRCTAEGARLTRIATGFWNPFHMGFDAFGRLFVVDNDADGRPPCRLIHIVTDGDYGYRFRNGRKGLHPFTAWNGELPGTLPMVSGTAEAPSGVVAYESDHLPGDYIGSLLVTSWGDHRIERYRLQRHGASFVSHAEPIVVGGEDFRPVGIAVAPDGSVYISDWVSRDYKLHGKGRLWRIAAKSPPTVKRADPQKDPRAALGSIDGWTRHRAARVLAEQGNLGKQILRQRVRGDEDPRVRAVAIAALEHVGDMDVTLTQALLADASADVREFAAATVPANGSNWLTVAKQAGEPAVRAAAIRRADGVDAADAPAVAFVLATLATDDPFLHQTATQLLVRSPQVLAGIDPTALKDPRQRVGVLLALRQAGGDAAMRRLPELLTDTDPDVLFAAVQWVGEARLNDHRDAVRQGLTDLHLTPQLLAAHLAALDLLDGGRPQSADHAGPTFYLSRLVVDRRATPLARRLSLRGLKPDHPDITLALLDELLESSDHALRLETVRALRAHRDAGRFDRLIALARDGDEPADLRAEAILGLSPDRDAQCDVLLGLADDDHAAVRAAALRTLRGATLDDDARARLTSLRQRRGDDVALIDRVLAAAEPANGAADHPPASDIDAWLKLLDGKGEGDPDAGQRIFHHPRLAGCYRCHSIAGRGGEIGPDLTLIGRSQDRRRILESILQPAREIAPHFTVWQVTTTDGRELIALWVGERPSGEQLYADAAGTITALRPAAIAARQPLSISIMPEGLPAALTVEELRDLVAYLSQLK